jgi:hypothetical protein
LSPEQRHALDNSHCCPRVLTFHDHWTHLARFEACECRYSHRLLHNQRHCHLEIYRHLHQSTIHRTHPWTSNTRPGTIPLEPRKCSPQAPRQTQGTFVWHQCLFEGSMCFHCLHYQSMRPALHWSLCHLSRRPLQSPILPTAVRKCYIPGWRICRLQCRHRECRYKRLYSWIHHLLMHRQARLLVRVELY